MPAWTLQSQLPLSSLPQSLLLLAITRLAFPAEVRLLAQVLLPAQAEVLLPAQAQVRLSGQVKVRLLPA